MCTVMCVPSSFCCQHVAHSISDGKRIPSSAATQAIEWATWTGVLGEEVLGVWPKYSQVNDINATHASYHHRTIVTGDDFGLVKLFRFPCTVKGKYTSRFGPLPLPVGEGP